MQKYFPLDKNYILESAQKDSRDNFFSLLSHLIKVYYFKIFNPLNLNDEVSTRINNLKGLPENEFSLFYDNLAAIYRLQHADNQLELLWDGTSHYAKFRKDWEIFYSSKLSSFLSDRNLLKVLIKQLLSASSNHHFLNIYLREYLETLFQIRIDRRKKTDKILLLAQ